MFANTFQSGFISIFYSVGSNPLQLWDKQVKNGHIRRIVDDEVRSLVLEISGTNVATTYITCPIKPRMSLGIKLPFLVMIIKNMKKYFTFEIQVLDDKDMHRRFRVSNFQSTTKVRPFCTTMPIGLSSGWNQVQFNLADFTKRAYGSTYLETTRVQIHANVRIRRIYFCDMLYSDEDMPNEYKLFLPTPGTRPTPKGPQKKVSDVAIVEVKDRKPSKEQLKIELPEQEVPSGAPPTTPAEGRLETPAQDEAATTEATEEVVEESPVAPAEEQTEVPPSEGDETKETTETDATTEATEEATVSEEKPADAAETPTTETQEAVGEGGDEAPPAEEVAEPAAEAPAEAAAEEVPAEAPAEATA